MSTVYIVHFKHLLPPPLSPSSEYHFPPTNGDKTTEKILECITLNDALLRDFTPFIILLFLPPKP